MQIIRILSGPFIGAIIGYFTNYIAVKMLFRPRNPIKIGKYTLPFTPGIIPKRKVALAKAIGNTVGNQLFGENEIKSIMTSDEMKGTIVNGIVCRISETITDDTTIRNMISGVVGEETYSYRKEELTGMLANRITQGLLGMDVGKIIADKGVEVIQQKLSNPVLSMLINEKTLKSIATPIGERINEYIETDGKIKIEGFVLSEVDELGDRQINSLISNKEAIMEKTKEKLGDIYTSFANNNVETFVKRFNISAIVEEKISNMSNESLETLALSVMKNELGTIVILGAVIGFVIGIFNIFI